MDPATAIPLHFTLEFVGVAVAGGLLAWAAQRRLPVLATGSLLFLAAQVIHAGLFLAEEEATAVLVLRLAGFALIAAGALVELGRREAGAAVPAAGGTALGLGVGAAASALLAAVGHRAMEDRRLWAAGWGALAAGELWAASATPSDLPLEADLGPHLVRALGMGLVGVWTWRRTLRSLRLRLLAGFVLVLLVIVAVAGGSVTRVATADARQQEVRRLTDEARAERALFVRANEAMRDDAAVVSRVLQSRDAPPEQVLTTLLEQVYADLDLIVLFDQDGAVRAQAGASPEELAVVRDAEATTDALAGGAVPPVSVASLPDAVLAVAAAPVFASQGAGNAREGAAVLARRLGRPSLEAIVTSRESEGDFGALLTSVSGRTIVASDDELSSVELPAEALRSLARGDAWRGEVEVGEERIAAAVPLTEDAEGGDGAPAALVLVSEVPELTDTALDLSRAFFGAVLAAALIAVLIALWTSSRIVRPVSDLTETARRVESGDLEATPNVTSVDEIGTLARAFGAMTTSLRETIAAEQSTRGRLETIVSGMGEGLVAMDEEYTITSFNPAAERITGVPADEAIGAKCHEVYGERTSGENGKAICEYICPLRHDGGVDGGVAIEAADGRTLGVAVTCSALRDADGELIGGVDLLRDVTPELQAERMKSNFLANISHELRTPLTPIRGYADILRRKELSKAQADEYLSEIVSSTKRLERIVAILVDVAAMEAGRLQVSPEPVSPRDLLHEAAARWEGRSEAHDVTARAAKTLPQVSADPALVARALDELVDNAVKFSPDGGAVRLRAKAVRPGVEITVADKGIGIPPEEIEQLTDAFVQADPSETRRFGGLGVGLPFVRRIVEGHGGTLSIDSTPGKGSAFSFVLPRARKGGRKRGSGA